MHDDPARWIEKVIKDFIAGPENSMQKWGGEPAWVQVNSMTTVQTASGV